MERAWGLSLEEGPWVQRLTRPLDSHVLGQGWPCPAALVCWAISQTPAKRVSEAQGRIEEKCRAACPTCPHSPAPVWLHSAHHPCQGQATRLPLGGPWSLQTHPGGSAQQSVAPWLQVGLPGALILSLLHAPGQHFQQGLWRLRPSPALPAGGPRSASPAPTAISAEEPRGAAVVLWVPGSLPLPSLQGRSYLLMMVSYHTPLPPPGERLCILVHYSEVPTSGHSQVQGSLCSISCWKPGSPPCSLSRWDPWSSRARDRRDERHIPYKGATEDNAGRARSALSSVLAP